MTATNRFIKGMRVRMTDEALEHFQTTVRQEGVVGWTPREGKAHVCVVCDNHKIGEYYHQSFWEPIPSAS